MKHVSNDLIDYTKLREELFKYLQGLEHCYRKDRVYSREDPKQVKKLNLLRLIKTIVITEMLKDKTVISQIGKGIEEDLKDDFSEHGGLIIYRGEKLGLQPISTAQKERDNGTYSMPEEVLEKEYAIHYHYHATTPDDSDYAGPSGFILFGGDFKNAQQRVDKELEPAGIVFTKLKGNKFDATIYFANAFDAKVVDLGIYNW